MEPEPAVVASQQRSAHRSTLGRIGSREADAGYVFSQVGAISASQMIRPFDRRADGLLPGEGGGAIVLKPLADACLKGDPIYAVIRGVGSASDGRDVDVLAPSERGQVRALERT